MKRLLVYDQTGEKTRAQAQVVVIRTIKGEAEKQQKKEEKAQFLAQQRSKFPACSWRRRPAKVQTLNIAWLHLTKKKKR